MPGKLWPTLFGEKKVIQYIWRSARLEPKPAVAVGTILFFVVLLAAVVISIFSLQNRPAELPVPSAALDGSVKIMEIPVKEMPSPHVFRQDMYQTGQTEALAAENPAATRPVSQKQPENIVTSNAETQTGQKEKIRNLLKKSPAAEFGWQYNNTYQDWRFYPGIDLIGAEARIPAFTSGQVEDVVSGDDLGLAVIVTSGQYKIYYASLKSALRQKGEKIAPGDPVGVGGASADEAGYRFHLRVQSLTTGKYINPLEVLPI